MGNHLRIHSQSGLSIVATVMVMMILALFAAVAVSLVITGTGVGIQEEHGDAAFYIAEGGVQYAIKNKAFPNYSTAGLTIPLGGGTFELSTTAYLTAAVAAGAGAVTVDSTASFPSSGKIIIDSEVMTYSSKAATTFTLSSTAVRPHTLGNSVYPVTTTTADPLVGGATISVVSTTGFAVPVIITIDQENIYCTGTNTPLTTQFTGCTRGYNGTTAAAHPSVSGVFPNVYAYSFSSIGRITSNPMANPTKRVVVANMTPRTRNAPMGWQWAPSKEWTLGAFAIKPAGGSSIAFDTSTNGQFSKTAVPPYQWSHTTTGTNLFLYVGLAIGKVLTYPLASATSVTYGGSPLTKMDAESHSTGLVRVEIWYMVNPPTGANNVVVTIPLVPGDQTEFAGGAASFTGVDQTSPINAPTIFSQNTGSLAQSNVTITTPGAWTVDALSQLATPNTSPVNASQVVYPQWNNIKVGGTMLCGSYINTSYLPGGYNANEMKVMVTEQY
jgi:hypothetical protein